MTRVFSPLGHILLPWDGGMYIHFQIARTLEYFFNSYFYFATWIRYDNVYSTWLAPARHLSSLLKKTMKISRDLTYIFLIHADEKQTRKTQWNCGTRLYCTKITGSHTRRYHNTSVPKRPSSQYSTNFLNLNKSSNINKSQI